MQKPLLCCLLGFGLAAARAEWIELQDGSRIEGTIVSVTPEAVRIEVQATPSIRETKSFPRTAVRQIRRSSQDDLAFGEVARMAAPSTADHPAVYDLPLGKLRAFMENYAYSRHMPEARRLAASLEAERARVAAGEVKVDGEWVSAEASPADRTEAGGRVQLSKMKSSADPAAALSAFEILEKDHATTSSYPEAVRTALSSIDKLRTELLRTRADLERRTREQEQGLQLASEDRRRQMEAGIAQENAAMQAQIGRVRLAGGKWLPVLADPGILEELSRLADSEEERLSRIEVDRLSGAVEAAQRARQQLDAGDLAGAEASLGEAGQLWPEHVLLASLQESLEKARGAAAPPADDAPPPTRP